MHDLGHKIGPQSGTGPNKEKDIGPEGTMPAPKLLEIFQLFTVDAPRWRVDRIAERMGISTSTAYRCIAELVRAGFLQPVSGGAYVLGPAFTEFDRRMRLSDPLLRAARPHMR